MYSQLAQLHKGIAPPKQVSHEIDFDGMRFAEIKNLFSDFDTFADALSNANIIEKTMAVNRNHERSIYRIGSVVIFGDSVYKFGFSENDGSKDWFTVDCLISG